MYPKSQILQEIGNPFIATYQNKQITWSWNNKKSEYTFEVFKGDEALWSCYFREESKFFGKFFEKNSVWYEGKKFIL